MNIEVLKVNNLTKKYKNREVVSKVSFSARAGEVLGFLGPNGAGKTTTIRMMTGLIKSDTGTVEICGHSIKEDFEKAIKNVGAIVETPHLYEYMTGFENLNLFKRLKKATAKDMEEAIELCGLGDSLKEKVGGYSLGMKQRLAIAIALLGSPRLLILDEPTNGLDPAGIRNLRLFLQRLAHEKGVCVFISSHLLQEMELTCDRVIIISNGKILASESIEGLKEAGKSLEDLFIEKTEKLNSL